MHTTVLGGIASHVAVAESARRPASAGVAEAACAVSELSIDASVPTNASLPIELRGEVDEYLHAVDARREHRHLRFLPRALVKISSKASTTSSSEPLNPRRSMLVLSRGARARRRRRAAQCDGKSTCSPSSGVWSILKSPVCTTTAARRLDCQRDAVRHAVRHAQELDDERADETRSRGLTRTRRLLTSSAASSSLFSTRASVNARSVDRPP
jgi:hypothetical protein